MLRQLKPKLRSVRRTVGVALLALPALLTACGAVDVPPERPAAHALAGQRHRAGNGRIGDVDAHALAKRIHERVNEVRLRNGLKGLAWNGPLVPIAQGHSRDMQARRYFAHVSPTGEDFSRRYQRGGFTCRVPVAPGKFLTGGENLAQVHQVAQWRVWEDGRREPDQVRSLEDLAEATVTGWWNSPPHKQNLLRTEWLSEAIGVVVAADGTVWVTQNFC